MDRISLINAMKRAYLLLAISLMTTVIFAQKQNSVLDQEVTITFEGLSLGESLAKLESKTGVFTAYNTKEVEDESITISFEKELLSEVLDALLSNKNLSYKLIGNTITIFRSVGSTGLPAENRQHRIEKHTINGYILDGDSKETLIGANLYIKDLDIGATTNEFGFYSITLPAGEYELSFSYIGYQSLTQKITLDADVVISPSLFAGTALTEVVVTDDHMKRRHRESKMSTNTLSIDKIESMPMLMGERDVIRLAQLMPGVQSGSEGSTGLYVRGGGPDQNLFLIDGVPIYNINHLFGFLSTLNGDAIKTAEVIKGGFPARYGGRLSSIVDVRMKDGNMEEIHGNVSIGLVSGKFNLEGPLIKDKTSFNISARRTWLDLFTTPIQKIVNAKKEFKDRTGYRFSDLNAKINHKFSDKSRLFLSTYLGKDHLNYRGEGPDARETGDLIWGNRIFSLRWNYQISPKLFSNTTIYRSQYRKSFSNDIVPKNQGITDVFSSKSNVLDYGARIDMDYLPSTQHHIRMGIGNIYHQFSPTANFSSLQNGSDDAVVNEDRPDEITAHEMSAYIEDDISIGSRITLNAGIHASNFTVKSSNYFTLQPRVAMGVQLNSNSSLKFSYSQMRQFIHLLASPGLGFPNDLWVTSTNKIVPEESTQYAAGYTRSLGAGYEITMEGYYKTMKNLLEYKSGFSFFTTGRDWENSVWVGDGESYGAELLLEKRTGALTGWLGYTLSRSDRTFPDLSQGQTFPYKFDRRHDVSLALTYKRSKRVDYGLIWVYGSGNTYTLGTKNYNAILNGQDAHLASTLLETFSPINHIEGRNNQRAPAYHRLDLSVNLHKEKKRGIRTWSFGLYNAYARSNPFSLTVEHRPPPNTDQLYLKQTSLLSIVPFVSYSLKF